MPVFAPFRRHLSVGWYAPMAKVDDALFDWHALKETAKGDDEQKEARPMRLQAEFKARRSGRLYLYLNDAVVLLPGLFRSVYDNNNGHAQVTVVERPAEEKIEAEEK